MKRIRPRRIITTLCLSALLFLSALVSQSYAAGKGPLKIETKEGVIQFNVEYAITQEKKAKGLMFRNSLGPREGMLFVYQSPTTVTMWMKNTPISLDMFFINRRGVIRYIEEKTQPNSTRHIDSRGKVSAVLELRGGSAEDFGIKVGDRVILAK
ncbi:DUF192 domain-containing protein [Terasakiella pusilla]|uniref:DUF192 domain-containing protein n=1 Tax=Terasakiella pusilla TaxID=64973 RepID=UPI000A02063D|nr:DUF192 domain-containing protein [Terasakiella pusilla]